MRILIFPSQYRFDGKMYVKLLHELFLLPRMPFLSLLVDLPSTHLSDSQLKGPFVRVTSPNPAGQVQLVHEIVLRLVALVTVSMCHYRHDYLINVHSSTRM